MKNFIFIYSKKKLRESILVVFLFDIFFVWLYFQRDDLNTPINDPIIHLLLLLVKILLGLSLSFMLISAILNAYFISKLDPKAQLEINNEKRYLLYSNIVNGEIKYAKANFDDIYLLRYNKTIFSNLCFYEILFKENEENKKIVVSIALTDNIEKKIDKTIKFIKEEVVFFDEFPTTIY